MQASGAQNYKSVWSIATYIGDSPLSLRAPDDMHKEAFTAGQIDEISATFVADPFMVCESGRWWLFFEVWNAETDRGEIGLASSADGFRWQYEGIVLREDGHLSYPYVFQWNGEYYMTPETLGRGCIQLYRAESFPRRWRPEARLVEGCFADPSVFEYQGRWWMFACSDINLHDTTKLFHSAQLTGPWKEHPRSPIIAGNPRNARPAGRVTCWNGKLLRYAQDCVPQYGTRVRAFEIIELTTQGYREQERSESPILNPESGWNSAGMHHVDPHPLAAGKWIACVDGQRKLKID